MRELVQEMLENQKGVEIALREWVKDKSIPLDERWEVFVMSGLGTRDKYHYEGLGKDYFMFDGVYPCEKYQTVYMDDVIQGAIENAKLVKDESGNLIKDSEGYYIPTPETITKVNAMKEQVLEDFIHSFVYDW